MAMSDSEYIRTRGEICPQCESTEVLYIEGVAVVQSGTASRTAFCTDCDAEWEEVYLLVRYSRISGFKTRGNDDA